MSCGSYHWLFQRLWLLHLYDDRHLTAPTRTAEHIQTCLSRFLTCQGEGLHTTLLLFGKCTGGFLFLEGTRYD